MPSNPDSIHVTRYANPAEIGWKMAIQPAHQKWCLFVDKDDQPHLYIDMPLSFPKDEKDESKGYFEHAFVCVHPPGMHEVDGDAAAPERSASA